MHTTQTSLKTNYIVLKNIEENQMKCKKIKNGLWILALHVRYRVLVSAVIQAYKTISPSDDKNRQFTMYMMRECGGIDSY